MAHLNRARLLSVAREFAAPGLLGASLGLAFEPWTIAWVAPFSIAGLALMLGRATCRRAVCRSTTFGVALMLCSLWWLNPSIGVGAWLGVGLMQGLWFGVWGAAFIAVRQLPGWPLWAAFAWWSIEEMRSRWPLDGFPWSRLGTLAIDTPWAPLLSVLGIGGTGMALVLVGFTLAHLIETCLRTRQMAKRQCAVFAGIVGATSVLAALTPDVQSFRSVPVAVIQGGVPGDGTQLAREHRKVTQDHRLATESLAGRVARLETAAPQLVVWPENSTAVDPFADPEARAAIESAVGAIGVPVMVGGLVDAQDPREVLNQSIVWDPVTGPGVRYTKRHPVPFGEFVPMRGLIGDLSERLAAIPRDMVPGGPQEPLLVAGLSVAVAICFDVAFDEVIREQVSDGAELVVVQTSNASFTGTSQPAQQFAITRARAVETGRSVVVASTNGISGVVAPDGSVVRRSAGRGTEVLEAEVAVVGEQTIAVRLSGFLTPAPFSISILALLARAASLRRRGAASPLGSEVPAGIDASGRGDERP